MKVSAGILLFKKVEEKLLFFLVHPGGPFFARKNEGFWTIPKGEIENGEEPLSTAKREFFEEIGVHIDGDFYELRSIMQKGGKKVCCWALAFDLDEKQVKSNTFEMQWPPKSGQYKTFPEIDRAAWFSYTDAKVHINERQIDFLDQVVENLGSITNSK